ncbi:MAG: hypothetical protein E7365_05980 [Clostridiales bacterium]|nr:hypothetical protein [Clostridiales bacterium]
MRNLTVKRTKSFVATLVKTKLYIEDPAGDVYIGDCLCRMLGTLKNGEEKTFEITEDAVKIYAISDIISKDWCNDFYQLPQSNEDIALTGKNRYNLSFGNSFVFDNNDNPQSNANRKKGKKIGLIVIACSAIIGFLIGLWGVNTDSYKEKVFAKENFSITLTEQFSEIEEENFFACYDSNIAAVFVIKESFEEYPDLKSYPLDSYAELVLDSSAPEQQLKNEDGLCYFEYVWLNDAENIVYHYNAYIFKTTDAYWIVNIASPNENYDDLKDEIKTWAKSIVFE